MVRSTEDLALIYNGHCPSFSWLSSMVGEVLAHSSCNRNRWLPDPGIALLSACQYKDSLLIYRMLCASIINTSLWATFELGLPVCSVLGTYFVKSKQFVLLPEIVETGGSVLVCHRKREFICRFLFLEFVFSWINPVLNDSFLPV